MNDTPLNMIGHNKCPDNWYDDESCEDLMKSLLKLKGDPFIMEACHLGYIQFFGESYKKSDFASLVRREIYNSTGREAQ